MRVPAPQQPHQHSCRATSPCQHNRLLRWAGEAVEAVVATSLSPLILQVQLLDSSFVEEDKKRKREKKERGSLP